VGKYIAPANDLSPLCPATWSTATNNITQNSPHERSTALTYFFTTPQKIDVYFSLIPDIAYRESILSFANAQHPVDSWKISYLFIQYNLQTVIGIAGFRPGSRGHFVSAKGPKTIDAPSGHIR